jgi:ATP-binding cassette, subfamily B, bacterial CvaB/MchF/RaxB
VPQQERADCGLAALAMVAQRCGARLSVESLRARAAPGPEGLTLQRLRHLAEEVGLPCRSAQVSEDRLGQVALPAVAHLSDGHYAVLHELRPSGVVVGDPATGIVTWDRATLTSRFSGVLLLFGPPGDKQ